MAGPRLGVSVFCHAEGRVVLVKRAKAPFAGVWSLPGGAVEAGERLRAAALREMREETRITVAVGAPIDVLEVGFDCSEAGSETAAIDHFVLIVFPATPLGGVLAAGDDAAEVRWVGLEELNDLELTPGTGTRLPRYAAMAGRGAAS